MLADLIDLRTQLARDRERDDMVLRRRDRGIGKKLRVTRSERRLRAWISELRHGGQLGEGVKVERVVGIACALLVLIGVTVGWGFAAVLLAYDGSAPINIIKVWVVLVGGQLLLLAGFAVLTIPHTVARVIPLLAPVQEFLLVFNPGRLVRWTRHLLGSRNRSAFDAIWTGTLAYGSDKSVYKWLALHLSQLFAVAFNLGAVAGCVFLVSFTDLAFAWSTTLELTPLHLHQATDFISLPWGLWYPRAVPALELLESSQFFRLDPGLGTGPENTLGQPAALGAWWPFLFMSLIIYGLLPRLVFLFVTRRRLHQAVGRALLDTPGAIQVLERMKDTLVQTRSVTREPVFQMESSHAQTRGNTEQREVVLIGWNTLTDDLRREVKWLRETLGISAHAQYTAGGGKTLSEDNDTLTKIADGTTLPVVFVVRASEAPMLEFWDYVNDIDEAIGGERSLYVCPLDHDESDRVCNPGLRDRELWSNQISHHSRAILLSGSDDHE